MTEPSVLDQSQPASLDPAGSGCAGGRMMSHRIDNEKLR